MSRKARFSRLSYPFIPMPTKTLRPGSVQWAVIRQVDIRAVDITNDYGQTSKQIMFSFSGAEDNVDVNIYHGGLAQLLKNLKDENIKVDKSAYKNPPTKPTKPKPITPLSLYNDILCYVIYVLRPGNWEYSSTLGPFTVEPLYASYYSNATRYSDTVAYFVADGAKAKADAPNNEYSHGINLHVDLIASHGSGKTPGRMPLIIDPDIRHPGGSGEP